MSLHSCLLAYWGKCERTPVLSMLSCPYGTYVNPYIMGGMADHSYRVPLLPPCVPIVLSHSVSSIEPVCPTVRPHLSDADRGIGWPLRLGRNGPVHCATYVLLPRSSSPYIHLVSVTRDYVSSCEHGWLCQYEALLVPIHQYRLHNRKAMSHTFGRR